MDSLQKKLEKLIKELQKAKRSTLTLPKPKDKSQKLVAKEEIFKTLPNGQWTLQKTNSDDPSGAAGNFKIPEKHHKMIMDTLEHVESPLSQHYLVRDILKLPELSVDELDGGVPMFNNTPTMNLDAHHDEMTSRHLNTFQPEHIKQITSRLLDAMHEQLEFKDEEDDEEPGTLDNHLNHIKKMTHLHNLYSKEPYKFSPRRPLSIPHKKFQ